MNNRVLKLTGDKPWEFVNVESTNVGRHAYRRRLGEMGFHSRNDAGEFIYDWDGRRADLEIRHGYNDPGNPRTTA